MVVVPLKDTEIAIVDCNERIYDTAEAQYAFGDCAKTQ
jgi:hypothetical protein